MDGGAPFSRGYGGPFSSAPYIELDAPGGTECLTMMEVRYERFAVEPFREPPGSEASAKLAGRRPTDGEETIRHKS